LHALALPKEAVRAVYLDGSGCYGMNGHDDARQCGAAGEGGRVAGGPVVAPDEHGWTRKGRRNFRARSGWRRWKDQCLAH
jgi:hypothetical protein